MHVCCIETSGLETLVQRSTGCSGGCIATRLTRAGLSRFCVDRRSADGRTWWFQATFQAGALGPATTTALTQPVIVTRLED